MTDAERIRDLEARLAEAERDRDAAILLAQARLASEQELRAASMVSGWMNR